MEISDDYLSLKPGFFECSTAKKLEAVRGGDYDEIIFIDRDGPRSGARFMITKNGDEIKLFVFQDETEGTFKYQYPNGGYRVRALSEDEYGEIAKFIE